VIAETIQFMQTAHASQERKYCGEAYSNHPLRVMGLLVRHVPRVSIPVLQAALLHDVVEDTKYTLDDLTRRFGNYVAGLVEEVTTPKYEGNRAERVAQELERLATISPDAQNIKYADILDNTKDIVKANPEFAPKYLDEKRRALTVMQRGYDPLRGLAWSQVLREIDNARQ
jgi:(p)ppGpp synthase/HD superfamily hydrolase